MYQDKKMLKKRKKCIYFKLIFLYIVEKLFEDSLLQKCEICPNRHCRQGNMKFKEWKI